MKGEKITNLRVIKIGCRIELRYQGCQLPHQRTPEVSGMLIDEDDLYYHIKDVLGVEWWVPKSRWSPKPDNGENVI